MVKQISYCHINAFGNGPFKGNQAAVMPLEAWLPDETLQAIGAENNFAETAFFVPDTSGHADFELRWFTPNIEIALCGHATLASGYYLLAKHPEKENITFLTRKAGILTVKRCTNNRFAVGLPAYTPSTATMPDWAASLDKNGLQPSEHHYHKGGYHIFLFEDAKQISSLSPHYRDLVKFASDNQFICTAPANADMPYDVISRVFVPGAGVDEDSVTGSAHALLTPFWTKRLGQDSFNAYQASIRGGYLNCSIKANKAWLSGDCAKIVEGIFNL